MKKTVTLFLSIVAVFFFSSNRMIAQSNTLVVYASGENLETVINNDTTSAGLQAHEVYKLVSLDTTYVFQSIITVKSDISVIGVLDPITGRPPCVQPISLPDGSLPLSCFMLLGENTKAVFKNLYLTGRSTDNTINAENYNGAGAMIQLAAKNIRLTVDNVVFADWPTNTIGYSADGASIFVTNSKFRNEIAAGAYYSGEGIRNTNNTATTDSMVVKDCTFFCINAYAACPVTVNPVKYFEFSNNNVMYTFKNPFWIYNITDGKFNNNLFYAAFAGASTNTEDLGMWDQLRSYDHTSVMDLDSLTTDFAKLVNPADSNDANVRMLTEAKRTIEVKNNVYFQPQAIVDFWATWNTTAASADSIVSPLWMNNRTIGMFADKTTWPGLVESGNMEVDPQFGPSIDDVLYNNTGSDAGFFEYFTDTRSGVSSTKIYGYKLPTVVADWIPEWPLPELNDMQYANTALRTGGTDGNPIGDRTWFNNGQAVGVKGIENQLPEKFVLENAYPNPFNPSTNIKFDLVKAGNIDLKIYNVMGQLVKTVVGNEFKNAGTYEYKIGMDNFASGLYFLTLTQGNQQMTKKLILLK